MSSIHELPGGHGEVRLNVLFLHGLDGHFNETWTCPGEGKVFWPTWLIDDAPGVRIATVEYDAALSRWKSGAMTVADRAGNIASQLAAMGSLQDRPLALVGHSLGGNIIKAVIRHLSDKKAADPRFEKLLDNIRLVVFLGTPNTGSGLQRLLPKFLQKALRYTPLVEELDNDSAVLRDLSQWYRLNSPKNAKHVVLVEAKKVAGVVKVVTPSSSDPGLPGIVPIAVDADHISICKPNDRTNEVYRLILDAVQGVLSELLPPLLQDPPSVVSEPADRLVAVVRDWTHASTLIGSHSSKQASNDHSLCSFADLPHQKATIRQRQNSATKSARCSQRMASMLSMARVGALIIRD
jgi:pimeloyl-ACP methyl ester carboxylesterase